MNKLLVEYGIFQEKSDVRVHVSPLGRELYVFLTINGIKAIETGKGRLVSVKRKEFNYVETARGYVVKKHDIEGIQSISIPNDLHSTLPNENDDTSTKGRKCVEIVKEMLQRGLLPVSLKIQDIDDKRMQISGLDIVVTTQVKIQVKCDFPIKKYGNIFLQTMECNLYGMV